VLVFGLVFWFFGIFGGGDYLLDGRWVLPVYAAVVLAEQGGEVFILGCEGGEVDVFVVVGALSRWLLGF
jgi:hypothetical protein